MVQPIRGPSCPWEFVLAWNVHTFDARSCAVVRGRIFAVTLDTWTCASLRRVLGIVLQFLPSQRSLMGASLRDVPVFRMSNRSNGMVATVSNRIGTRTDPSRSCLHFQNRTFVRVWMSHVPTFVSNLSRVDVDSKGEPAPLVRTCARVENLLVGRNDVHAVDRGSFQGAEHLHGLGSAAALIEKQRSP